MSRERTEIGSLGKLIDESALNATHWRIWLLSAAGVFLDGFDLFIIGVAMPLIVHAMNPSPFLQGLIGAAAVVGAMIGAGVLGHFTDRWGRKYLYLVDLSIFIVFAVLSGFSWNVYALIVFRFLLGLGVGADYPICAAYVSEFMPARIRGRMLIGAFAFQSVGMLFGALVGVTMLTLFPYDDAWRYMVIAGALPAGIMLVFRISVPESPRWLLSQGRVEEAVTVLRRLVPGREKDIDRLAAEQQQTKKDDSRGASLGYGALFSKRYLRRTILAAVPWFLMDVATYGVGLFTPVILAAMAFGGPHRNFLAADFAATEGAAYLDIFLILGFVLNLLFIERWGRIRLQVLGLAGMTLGLVILALAASLPEGGPTHIYLIFLGFTLFNLLMNMGPNGTTFILAAELFPTEVRASGHGFSAGMAKFGAALGIFFLPVFKDGIGIPATLLVIAAAPLLGLIVTAACRIDTTGKPLEGLEI